MSQRIVNRGRAFSIGNGVDLVPVAGCDVIIITPALHKLDEWHITARSVDGTADVPITRAELQALADWAHAELDYLRIAEIAGRVVEGYARVAKEQAELAPSPPILPT